MKFQYFALLASAFFSGLEASDMPLDEQIMMWALQANAGYLWYPVKTLVAKQGADAICFKPHKYTYLNSGRSRYIPDSVINKTPYEVLFNTIHDADDKAAQKAKVADCLKVMFDVGAAVECPPDRVLGKIVRFGLGQELALQAIEKGCDVNDGLYDITNLMFKDFENGFALYKAALESDKGKRLLSGYSNPLKSLPISTFDKLEPDQGLAVLNYLIDSGAEMDGLVIQSWINSVFYGGERTMDGYEVVIKALQNPYAKIDGQTIEEMIEDIAFSAQHHPRFSAVVPARKAFLLEKLEEARETKPYPVHENGEQVNIIFNGTGTEKEVIVTGTFDGWQKTLKLPPSGITGQFKKAFLIRKDGSTQFKFVVDGQWMTSPDYPTTDDGHGNINNVL